MRGYQAGDFSAARSLIEQVSPRLLRFFLSQSTSRSDAEDLVQETWLRIHRVRHTYRPGESVMAWSYAIARHARLDHYRRVVRTSAQQERLDEGIEPLAIAPEQDESEDELEAMLAPLSEGQREIIEMLKVAGMSLEEVARATCTTVGAVKQKVHRAYKILRKTIAPDGLKRRASGGLA